MEKLRLERLSKTVRAFLDQARKGGGVLVEDDQGRTVVGIIPYLEATPEEQERAWREIEEIQAKVAQSMRQHGVTEEDLVQEILKDD